MMVDEPILDEAEPILMEVTPTWTDIDELDLLDPQAVTTYVEDIYDNCRQKEVRFEARKSLVFDRRRFGLVRIAVSLCVGWKSLGTSDEALSKVPKIRLSRESSPAVGFFFGRRFFVGHRNVCVSEIPNGEIANFSI